MSIAVYGDVIIDEYIYGTATRLSPEAPVPVVDYVKTDVKLGGAGNVYNNIKALTKNVTLNTDAEELPVKKRIFADGHYVTRVDVTPKKIKWKHKKSKASVFVFSDYNKGSYDALYKCEHDLTKRFLIAKTIVDPKVHLSKYADCWCLKPNKKEFEAYVECSVNLDNLESLMISAYNALDVHHLIVTLGSDGVSHYSNETGYTHFPAEKVDVSDVTGAGDTFTAVLAYAIDQGKTMLEAIALANKASGIAVKHHGTYVITLEDLGLVKETTVFTNGCFDILHPGHIHMLREAKKLGTKLIVAVNSDASVKRLKGPSRPVNSINHRVEMIKALGIADEVVVFDEDTPAELIAELLPDIIVKGGDYYPEDVVGFDVAKVVIIPTLGEYSTTNIIKGMNNGTI